MTTIAYDGNLLCTDSQANAGHILQQDNKKIFTFTDEKYVAVALCGILGDSEEICNWILGGNKPEFKNDSGCFCVDKDGNVWRFHTEDLGSASITNKDANGSGSEYAIGAMLAGASAFQAVEIASRLDQNTGGSVQCYNIKTKELTGPFR